MSKKMLINATHPEENRVAIVEDGILTELDIEIAGKEQTRGNIYKAAVVRVEPGLQAAFIDYGAERFGFLQMGELHPSLFRPEGGNGEGRGRRINDVLRRGQELLVQVVKEERGTKGAALTTFLSLPGRYMVLMPDSDTKGVSRKIEEEGQRKKLKEAMASLDLPGQMGYIVRTAGIGQKKEELKRDFDYLVRVWEKIREQSRQSRAPSLIYKESNLVIRSIRDYFSADMDEVLVDDPRVCQEAKDFFQEVMPEYARLVKHHQEKRPIFSRYQIEEQIETITKNKVPLPSGGSIVIDTTEALVAIDVNSGKMAGESNIEATAYKTNLEAATEVGRQLRLRDLGGLIVIDFIDMRDRKHTREVEKALKESLKTDKARVTVGRISQFGLLEMSRQRIKATLAEGAFLPCPHCNGSGKVKSAEAQAIAFLRKVHAAIAKGQFTRIDGEVPLEVATYLLNTKREELVEMERRHQAVITIKGHPNFLAGQTELTVQKREKEEGQGPEPFLLPVASAPLPAGPAPGPAASETAETGKTAVDAESADAETEAGKKKRKRKRKKKKTEETAETPAALAEAVTGPDAAESHAAAPLAEPPAAGTETAAADEAVEGEHAEERKKKRRRRRKKKTPAEAGAEAPAALPQAAAEAAASEAAGEEPAPAAGGQPDQQPAARKARRRRPRKKPEQVRETAEATPGSPPAAEPQPAAEAPAPSAAGPAEGGQGQGAVERARSPRTRKQPAAASAPAEEPEAARREETPAAAAKETADSGEKGEPGPAKPKPTRKRPARKTASGKPEETPPAPEMDGPGKQEPPAAADTAESPKPKRRPPRKKAAAAKNPETESTAE